MKIATNYVTGRTSASNLRAATIKSLDSMKAAIEELQEQAAPAKVEEIKEPAAKKPAKKAVKKTADKEVDKEKDNA